MAHCQKITERSDGFGMSIPAFRELHSKELTSLEAHADAIISMVTALSIDAHIKLVGTKALIRKGSGTGSPVSGCIDELTTAMSSQQTISPARHPSWPTPRSKADEPPTLLGVPIPVPFAEIHPAALRPRLLDQALEPRHINLGIFQRIRRS